MKYTIEDVRKILEEKEVFKFIKINNNGKKDGPFEANIIFFENWLINNYQTKEFCVGLQEYDTYNITPISKIVEIL